MILIGPPGSGKGTQAKLLSRHFGVPDVSSGELLRGAAKRRTPIGVQAKRYMDRGELVPDDIVLGAVEERLRESDCANGFILDGFPRTLAQEVALTSMLATMPMEIKTLVSLNVPRDELVKRLSGRRTCRDCGASYHIIFGPPRNPGICNNCNGEVFQRGDDQEDTVVARLEVYDRNTAPLIAAYRRAGVLREVDGVGGQEQILGRILAQVQKSI